MSRIITVNRKDLLFSKSPGSSCLIPHTFWGVRLYPAKGILFSLEGETSFTFPLPFVGNCMLQQDLRRGCVFLSGKEGRFRLFYKEGKILLFSEKTKETQTFSIQEIPTSLHPTEVLSLGVEKKQEMEGIRRRGDLKEILPLLFHLSQKVPQISFRSEEIPWDLSDLKDFCVHYFSKGFLPRLVDEEHQGITCRRNLDTGSPQELFSKAYGLIRSLFFEAKEGKMIWRKPLFVSGRLLRLQVEGLGEVDLEWRKWGPFRMRIRTFQAGRFSLQLPEEIASFRFNKKRLSVGIPLLFEAKKSYLFDQFHRKIGS